MPAPLINGTSYAWSQIQVLILNQPVNEITAVSYEDTQEMQDNFGAGEYPISRGYGKVQAKATVTMAMAEVVALQAAAPQKSLNRIPEFDVVVSYQQRYGLWPPVGGKIVTDVIKNCRFKGNKRDTKEGDLTIPVELEMITSHIIWGG